MRVIKDKPNSLFLLGGGSLLRDLCLWSNKKNISIKVLTSVRHSLEVVNDASLADFLANNHIEHMISDKISNEEVASFIGDTSKTFCLSLGAAWIFNKDLIKNLFNNQLFNLHGTRLPQNRGGASISWQILSGSRFGFCQLHLIDGGIDTGDILRTKEFLYPYSCRIPKDFEKVYIEKNLSFIKNIIDEIFNNGLDEESKIQTEYLSTYWPRLNSKIHGWVNWDYDLLSIEKFICAFDDPYSGASTTLNGNRVFLKKVSVDFSDGSFHKFQSGLIYRVSNNWICVALSEGTLIIEEVMDSSGENIISSLKVGDRFISPNENLIAAKDRIIYTPSGLKKL